MNNKELFDTVTYKGKDYPYRSIVIFQGNDEECNINVSNQSLGSTIIINYDECCYIDNLFACFVEDDLLGALSDEELVKHIEDNYYLEKSIDETVE